MTKPKLTFGDPDAIKYVELKGLAKIPPVFSHSCHCDYCDRRGDYCPYCGSDNLDTLSDSRFLSCLDCEEGLMLWEYESERLAAIEFCQDYEEKQRQKEVDPNDEHDESQLEKEADEKEEIRADWEDREF